MIFRETRLSGCFVIELEKRADERGWFARTWCRDEFSKNGIEVFWVQGNSSFNSQKGTLRGMHFQLAPCGEAKLIRCCRGRAYDVALDLRPESPTFKQWTSVELAPDNGKMIFIPEGFAHGFQTLEDGTELLYQMSENHHPQLASGVRWNDAAFGILWPLADPILSPKDQAYPDYEG